MDDRCRTRGKREVGEMSQRTRRDRYGGKAKEETGSSEKPRAEQETAYTYCLWLKALVVV